MKPPVGIILGIIVSIIVTESIAVSLVPQGKELIYHLEATVAAGARQPSHVLSEYKLHAKLHLQSSTSNQIEVYLKDATYQLHNGNANAKRTSNLPLPAEAAALQLPFQLTLNPTSGMIEKLVTDANDVEWSLNIKKGLAALLQATEVSPGVTPRVREPCLYGQCTFTYTLLRNSNNTVMYKTSRIPQTPDAVTGGMLHRTYHLMERGNQYVIERLIARSEALTSGSRYTNTERRLTYLGEQNIAKPVQVTGPSYNNLVAENKLFKCSTNAGLPIDVFTNGRTTSSKTQKEQIKIIMHFLEKFFEFYDKDHITLSKPNVGDVSSLEHVLNALAELDADVLNQIYEATKDRVRTLYVQLLAHVHTPAAAVTIRNLIRDNKLNADELMYVIPRFSLGMRCVNEALVKELEDLLTIQKDNPMRILHRAMVLAFSNLADQLSGNGRDKYRKMFLELLNESADGDLKLLYFQALLNVHGFDSLETVIKDNTISSHIRNGALWSLMNAEPSTVMKLAWDILSDYSIDVNLRITSYTLYIKIGGPTLNRYLALNWLLENDPNEQLYSFHYNTMRGLADNGCEYAKIVFKQLRQPLVNIPVQRLEKIKFEDPKSQLSMDLESAISRGVDNLTIRLRLLYNGMELYSIFFHGSIVHHNSSLYNVVFLARQQERTILSMGGEEITYTAMMNMFGSLLLYLGIDVTNASSQQILQIPVQEQYVVPNDFGSLVLINNIIPLMFDLKITPTKEFSFALKLFGARYMQTNVYNPIANLWHGTQQTGTFSLQLPFMLTFNQSESGTEILFRPKDNQQTIGYQTHVSTIAFTASLNPHKLDVAVVSRGDDYRVNTRLEKNDFLDVGRTYEEAIFDCEHKISRGTLISVMKAIEMEDSIMAGIMRMNDVVSHSDASCGYGFRFQPLDNVELVKISFGGGFEYSTLTLAIQLTATDSQKVLVTDTVKFALTPTSTLRKWDIDLAAARKVANAKDETRFNVNGQLNIGDDNIHSRIQVTVADVGLLNLTMKAVFSPEQESIFKKRNILPEECQPVLPYDVLSYDCVQMSTSLRKYAMDMKFTDHPWSVWMQGYMQAMGTLYEDYAQDTDQETSVKDTGHYHVEMVFPVFRQDEVDVKLEKDGEVQMYTGLPADDILAQPINLLLDTFLHVDDLASLIVATLINGYMAVDRTDMLESCMFNSTHMLTVANTHEVPHFTNQWSVMSAGDKIMIRSSLDGTGKHLALEISYKDENKTETWEIRTAAVPSKYTYKFNNEEFKVPLKKRVNNNNFNVLAMPYPPLVRFRHENYGIFGYIEGSTIHLDLRSYNFQNGECRHKKSS